MLNTFTEREDSESHKWNAKVQTIAKEIRTVSQDIFTRAGNIDDLPNVVVARRSQRRCKDEWMVYIEKMAQQKLDMNLGGSTAVTDLCSQTISPDEGQVQVQPKASQAQLQSSQAQAQAQEESKGSPMQIDTGVLAAIGDEADSRPEAPEPEPDSIEASARLALAASFGMSQDQLAA